MSVSSLTPFRNVHRRPQRRDAGEARRPNKSIQADGATDAPRLMLERYAGDDG